MSPRSIALLALLTVCRLAAHEEPAQPPAPKPSPEPAVAPVGERSTPAETSNESSPKTSAHEAAPVASEPAPLEVHPSAVAHAAAPQSASSDEIASLLHIGQTKLEKGDWASAELAYRQVLAERATTLQDRDALIGLARTYRKKGDFTKAAAVYERTIKEYPGDESLPILYLELGRTLRTLGAHKQAIGRFYSVINSTLKLPDQGPELYRQLARTAQFEIAETYFQSGDFDQATRFFTRLKLLDLAPEDRARAHFKSAFSLNLSGENDKAITSLRAFLEQYPDDENIPEARYLLSISLRKIGRSDESLAAALELLKTERVRTEHDPKRWAYWQRKTGNQLANEFYEKGDFTSALLIYQNLSQLSPELTWKLPAAYQMGLCNERLQLLDRARDCYQTIIDNVKASPTDSAARPELGDLSEMAAWRLNQLAWQQSTDKQISVLFPNTAPRTAIPVLDHAHDVHGSAANPPVALR